MAVESDPEEAFHGDELTVEPALLPLAPAAATREREAVAVESGNEYKLAVELYTNAMDAGAATADLYADRARARIMLGDYTEAVVDANKAIELDPMLCKAYILKGVAHMELREYENAKAALELRCSYALESDNSKIDHLLKVCNDQIAERASQVPVKKPLYSTVEDKEDASLEVRQSTIEASTKPKHAFYNTPTGVVLTVFAEGVPVENVVVNFGEEKVSISIEVPGEEPYHFEPHMFNRIIPEKCKYQVSAARIDIFLAKAELVYWTSLEKNRSDVNDYEFSWKETLLREKDILPTVRDQGNTHACVFQSLSGTTEMQLKRKAALEDPPETSGTKVCTESFINDYESVHGHIPNDDTKFKRLRTALDMLKDDGVLMEEEDGRMAKRKINQYKSRRDLGFGEIARLIRNGRPIVGAVRVDDTFGKLKPDEIYDFDEKRAKLNDSDVHYSHALVFVGYGVRDGRAYLVFMNNYGTDFCDEGFGRVYFDRVRRLTTIDI